MRRDAYARRDDAGQAHEAAPAPAPAPAIDGQAYRRVLGHYPTGVCAITACADDGTLSAMIAGTFMAVSLDPPLVGFLPARTSASWALIRAAGRFCANVLGADQHVERHQLSQSRADKCAGLRYRLSPNGSPILGDAIAWIDCVIEQVVDAGDHHLVLGRVLAMDVARTDGDPMIFLRGAFGAFAEAGVVPAP